MDAAAIDAASRYVIEWTATKPRWGPTGDPEEQLARAAEGCPGMLITYEPAP